MKKRLISLLLFVLTVFLSFNFSYAKSEAATPEVMAGVKQFQTYINSYLPSEYLGTPLVVDGYFGEASQAAFNLHVGSIKRYQTGFWVYMLQGLLYGNGYNPNGFDGSYGSGGGTGCLNAVNQYKADKNITEYPDTYWGEVGTETMASLCWKTYVEPLYFPIERGLENATYYIKKLLYRRIYNSAIITTTNCYIS